MFQNVLCSSTTYLTLQYQERLAVSYVFVGGFQNQRLQLTEAFVDAFATPSFDQRFLYLQL